MSNYILLASGPNFTFAANVVTEPFVGLGAVVHRQDLGSRREVAQLAPEVTLLGILGNLKGGAVGDGQVLRAVHGPAVGGLVRSQVRLKLALPRILSRAELALVFFHLGMETLDVMPQPDFVAKLEPTLWTRKGFYLFFR